MTPRPLALALGLALSLAAPNALTADAAKWDVNAAHAKG